MKNDPSKTAQPAGRRLIRIKAVSEKLGGRSVSSIWADIAAGRLPKPVKLGGSSFWDEDEIDELIEKFNAETGLLKNL